MTEGVIVHGTQTIVLNKDEVDNIEELILNISVEDLVENMELETLMCYTKVIEFFKKVNVLDSKLQIHL